uniref:Uncharacterized protein n=1 Tax=Cryptomonas curvata TaxID=233186 RepID=A0A7S0N8B8_9CRYP
MILQTLCRSLLAGTFPDPPEGAYIFTNDPSYGDGSYVAGYNALWGDEWKHMDNLDHIRPSLGLPNHDTVSAWHLPGRDFPGPAADPIV